MMKYPSTYQEPSSQKIQQQTTKDSSAWTSTKVTVEATLTRQLGIRFIDARRLATEAKINLYIFGYPNAEQENKIIEEALTIFESKSVEDRISLLESNDELEYAKSSGTNSISNLNNSSLKSLETSKSTVSTFFSSHQSSPSSPKQSSERSIIISRGARKLVRMISTKKLAL